MQSNDFLLKGDIKLNPFQSKTAYFEMFDSVVVMICAENAMKMSFLPGCCDLL